MTIFKQDKINFKKIIQELGFPVFVKPANMGGSVGVSKAENEQELKAAVAEAFKFDIKVLVEKGLTGREIETAVLGNIENLQVSGIGKS
ncbi:MAG: hypothetical protein R2788_01795 [Saprospiraceae bacterium]